MMAEIDEQIQRKKHVEIHLDGDSFNEIVYRQSKPAFIAAYNQFKNSITDVKSLMRGLIRVLHKQFDLSKKTICKMEPYIIEFTKEVSTGVLTADELPPHLYPMKIESFNQLTTDNQAKHKNIANKIARCLMQRIAEENWKYNSKSK